VITEERLRRYARIAIAGSTEMEREIAASVLMHAAIQAVQKVAELTARLEAERKSRLQLVPYTPNPESEL
jgi:hypothetical protein